MTDENKYYKKGEKILVVSFHLPMKTDEEVCFANNTDEIKELAHKILKTFPELNNLEVKAGEIIEKHYTHIDTNDNGYRIYKSKNTRHIPESEKNAGV